MATKTKTPWARYTTFDEGEFNPVGSSATRDYLDGSETIVQKQKYLVEKALQNKKIDKTGPFLAVVLKVLSGPQANNEASTNGGNLTNALNISGLKDPTNERREEQQKPAPIKIIARIPEVHNYMDWPETVDDEDVICLHSEFHQFDESPDFELIRAGSIVWVQFYSLDHVASKSGFPSGIILGLYDKGSAVADESLISPIEEFDPPCKALRNLDSPGDGLYRGHTEANPVLLPGPPIVKFKNRIPTGFFGNGSLATKANFDASMQLADLSFKHNIPGSAPDFNNAFIWVGQLKNNGYLDTLNKPGFGRETIIYAPYSLDVNSPIEIKYYFHDKNGFGNAFSSGEDSQEAAVAAAVNHPNDFKDKIAPAIKDFVKDGRNIVLVIPELLHSQGYNTRFNLESQKESFKENLEATRIAEDLNAFQLTPFSQREVKSFDRTYIGGNFIGMHGEVLDLMDSYLGAGVSEQVQYVSMVGDGVGGIVIAAMAQNSITSQEIRNDFKIQRIDFIDTGVDKVDVSPALFDNGLPSLSIYTKIIRPSVDEEARRLQFNYVATPSAINTNNFFTALDAANTEPSSVLKVFKQNNGPPDGSGELKFTIPVSFPDTTGGPTDVVISYHTAKEDANVRSGYALSMYNPEGNQALFIKSDSNSNLFAAANKVPDHADIASAAQAAADLAKIQKRIDSLYERIVFFENMLASWTQMGKSAPCYPDSPYGIYCKDGYINSAKNTRFFTDYLNYITDKIDLEEMNIVNDFETQLLEANIYTDRLNNVREQAVELLQNSRDKIKLPYAPFGGEIAENSLKILKQRFDINDFFTPAAAQSAGSPSVLTDTFPEITALAKIIAGPAAYQKILNKIDNTLEKLKSRPVKLSPECAPPPIKLGEAVGPTANQGQNNAPATQNCGDIKIALVDNFADLVQMINYVPDKNRFTFQNKISTTKTKLEQLESFQLGTFKYKSRGANGQVTVKESPPLWKCITDNLSNAWEQACNQSNYVPFEIVNGIRGYGDYKGYTAYTSGVSLHSFGLAFDIDPYIAGYANTGTKIINSVFTGAWSEDFLNEHGLELWKLGVFSTSPSLLIKNAREAQDRLRQAENWRGAPSAYKSTAEGSTRSSQYDEIMSQSKGSLIVPADVNPTLWLLTFCELSKMRWGNVNFLKKRHRNGKMWNSTEKQKISDIYGIPNIVDRVKEISWKTSNIESHMHFQFWNGGALVRWKDIQSYEG